MKKTISINKIYSIFKKYGNLGIKVNTPYGFKNILMCDITEKNSSVMELYTDKNLSLKCSPNHLIKCSNGKFLKCIELIPGNAIDTIYGKDKVKSINILSEKKDLFDIQVDEVEQYYSNGITSHNSSILDALSFCLFDKFSRGYKAKDVLNVQKSSFHCKLNFEISDVDFFIERKGVINRKGDVKVDVKFWKVENGKSIDLNGEARRNTNDLIKEYVGTYEDFVLTALSVQSGKNVSSFIDMGQSERKDLLSQFIGLEIFDRLLEVSSKQYRDIYSQLGIYKKDDNNTKLESTKNELSSLTQLFDDEKGQYSKYIEDRNILNGKILDEVKQLKPIDSRIMSVDPKKNRLEIDRIKNIIDIVKKSVQEHETSILKTKVVVDKLDNEIQQCQSKNLDKNLKKYNSLKNEFNEIEKLLASKKSDVQNKISRLNLLKKYEFDPNCKFCVNRNKTEAKEIKNIKDQLISDEKVVTEFIANRSKIKSDLESLNWVTEENQNYTNLLCKRNEEKDNVSRLEKNIATGYLEIQTNEKKLESLNKDIEEYNIQIEFIEYNKNIQSVIDGLKFKLKNLEFDINNRNSKLQDINSKMVLLKSKIEELTKLIDKIKNLESECSVYELYTKAVNRDGIPYMVICNVVPEIEKEVNEILHQTTEFQLNIENDGKNIIPYIVYDDKRWPIEMASGFEKFISSLAIRVALTNISNLSKMNGIIIDEGWGVMDSDNLSQVKVLLSFLKTNFDFIVVISHLDNIKDVTDGIIEIKKDNGFSSVNFV